MGYSRVGVLDDRKKNGIRTIRLVSFGKFDPRDYFLNIPKNAKIRIGKDFATLFFKPYHIAEISFQENNGERYQVKYRDDMITVKNYLKFILSKPRPYPDTDRPEYKE